MDDLEKSLSDEATFAGAAKRRPTAEMSLGNERTLGDRLGDQDTVIDDIEIVDLEARYKIEGTLGRGGMGEVLLALDTRLGRKVAIKRILGDAARSTTAINRFIAEAKAVAALNHPNIVQIYDYGRASDGPFLIMEFVDGSSLLDRCRESALPLEEAINLACQLCDGLGKAHDLGIVHRDIKPANVLLTKDGVPKLTDFGLAKAEASDHQMTMTGAVLGTPDFMPPEQRRDASEVDARSDLWSLAATVYQMVTGRSPKIIRFDLLPPNITKVLGKALEDAKNERFQTAREFRDALKSAARKGGSAHLATMPGEGECPACGVQNDPSRRFCRSCGTTLEAPCLSCDKPMPMWEEICGSCGAKQTPIVEQRRDQMANTQAQAEGLLSDFLFDKAAELAAGLRDQPHPRLVHLKDWATDFLIQVERTKTEQVSRAREAIHEALAHDRAYDYAAGVRSLVSIPEILRESVSGAGRRETAAAMLSRLESKLNESTSLDAEIREAIKNKALPGLLPKVTRLAQLRPDRADVIKVRQQLDERLQRLTAKRDELYEQAREAFRRQDYASSLALFSQIDAEVMTDAISKFGDTVSYSHERSRTLLERIKSDVADQRYDGLLENVEEYLTLKPTTPDIEKLRSHLTKRAERLQAEKQAHEKRMADEQRAKEALLAKQAAEEAERRRQAFRREIYRSLVVLCLLILTGIGSFFLYKKQMRDFERATALKMAIDSGRWEDALVIDPRSGAALVGRARAQLATRQPDITAVLADVEAAQQSKDAEPETLRELRAAALLARAHAKLAASPPDVDGAFDDIAAVETLSASPDAVQEVRKAALLVRARNALSTNPARFEDAFADLKALETIEPNSPQAKELKATALAARAAHRASEQKFDDAEKDLLEAKRVGASPGAVWSAQTTVAASFLARAKQLAVTEQDIDTIAAVCDSALRAGAAKEQVTDVWLQVASAVVSNGNVESVRLAIEKGLQYGLRIQQAKEVWERLAESLLVRGDALGLEATCAAKEEYRLQAPQQAAFWLRFAEAALGKGNAQAVAMACDKAVAAGRPPADVASLRSRGILLEARAALDRGEDVNVLGIVTRAFEVNESATLDSLRETEWQPLREVLLRDYRARFDAVAEANDFRQAARINAEATRIDPKAASWYAGLVTPQRLETLSPEEISALPADAVLALPPIENSLGMKFKLIPAGTFVMGEDIHPGLKPYIDSDARHVTIHSAFYIGIHEVTRGQSKDAMPARLDSSWKDDPRPVTNVSRDEVVEFCRILSDIPKEKEAGRVYRLPTEAEWEYACRAGTNTKWSFGDDEELFNNFGWCEHNTPDGGAQQVGQKKPNQWGLFDMHGNVSEWCSDTINGNEFIYRGGSWAEAPWRSWQKRYGLRQRRDDFLGFRLAISPPGNRVLNGDSNEGNAGDPAAPKRP